MGAPGFDDAPMWKSRAGDGLNRVTIVYPYYDNPKFLLRQLEGWQQLHSSLKEQLHFIIVDDCSPETPAFAVIGSRSWDLSLRLFRIEQDVRWNWLAARNIGMNHAPQGWCVITDMDHVLPLATIEALVFHAYDTAMIYRFSRQEFNGDVIHPHPNSMLMTREMFWKIGGYDETLSGFYGTDGDWRRRCVKAARIATLSQCLVRYEHQGDSSTKRYLRKQPEDAGKKAVIAKRGPNWRPRVLSFPYHEVSL